MDSIIPESGQPVRFLRAYQTAHFLVPEGCRGEVMEASVETVVVRLYEFFQGSPTQVSIVTFGQGTRRGSTALEAFYQTCEMVNRRGIPWERYPGTGVYIISLGPQSPIPGERLQLIIYDQDDRIARRFEEERGNCIDQGYVDFFNSSRCRPAVDMYRLVDIGPNSEKNVIYEYLPAEMSREVYFRLVTDWVACYGVPQEDR